MEETSMSEMMLTLTEWKGFGVMQKLGCATAEGSQAVLSSAS